ncbi:MAG: hydroxyacid dehydrogenase [Phycisphaerae bacterium]|jgi:D-3-phosphoglycerate dehydrogenase|nr:hydroxyacid dehydrogenase [Phycisphaerae bacterium]HPC23366.1 hydroxyacid dehydrogenase [Phycisphaerae bacterium]HRS28387.1 hydroxyacid dehydrogenase [Phycisphaerae bacterium]HRT42516.1 hydroxyacid dehydrogenase [Phycisphaerae bacterium]
MKILIADKFEAFGIQQLKEITDGVVCEPELKDETLTKRIAEFDPAILIVRSTKVQAPQFDAGKSLKLVIRAGSGVDTIDVPYATKKGIKVANCPGMNAIAVAELVMGHMLNMDRRIADNVADARAHKWNKKEYSKAAGLKGRTLGIVGVGRIGSAVAKRALAFEMNVLYYDVIPDIKPADDPHCKRASLDDLFKQSDIITLHVPGTGETKHLVNAERIATMKKGAMIINTSRASVVDEPALIAALKSGHLKAAAVDVYDNEPAADAKEITSPLVDVPNLYGTHHIGASTDQAQAAVAEETVRIVREFKKSGKALNAVN